MTTPITLTVFSDAHPALGRPRGRELLGKRGLSALSRRLRRRLHDGPGARAALAAALAAPCDMALTLGDMVNFGSPGEFEAAAAAPRLGRLAGGGRRRRRFSVAAPRRRRGADRRERAVATPPFFTTGSVGADRLSRLRAILAATWRAGLARVAPIHRPPTAIALARKAPIDAAALRAALIAEGAELVLHGQRHRFALSWIGDRPGRIPVVGAPPLSLGASAAGDPTRRADGCRCG